MIKSEDIKRLRGLVEFTYRILNNIQESLPKCVNSGCVKELKVAKDLVRATKKITENLECHEVLEAIDHLNKKSAGRIQVV